MTTDEKLDLLLSKMATIESTMATKQDIADMVTNSSLDERLNDTENTILEELDTVQEKSNKHYNDIEGQLKMANSAINAIKIENSTVNIMIKTMSDLQDEIKSLRDLKDEVKILKERLDKVS